MALGAGAVLLRLALGTHPELIEKFYSRGIFLGVRALIDYLIAWFPIPLIYVFVGLVLALAWRKIRAWRVEKKPVPFVIKEGVTLLLGWIGGLAFLFLFLWGFNYGRVPIEDQLGLTVKPLHTADLRNELERELLDMVQKRGEIPEAGREALTASFLPDQLENRLRNTLEETLRDQKFPVVGRVRARQLFPKGIFLRFSSSGLYFPFVGEGNFDAGVHALLRPYVMTHEMAHGYGFGDEGTCNFLAYLSCTRSPDPVIAYAGHLNYYRTVASQYLRQAPEEYTAFRKALPAGIRADLDAINANLAQYPDIMPRFRYYAYDTYLKAQGIPEGMLNYNRVVMLVRAWKQALRM